MRFDEVRAAVEGVPHTTPERGRQLYDFVLEHRPERILELGFASGVSACYLAAALDELGRGQVLTIDTVQARTREPSVTDLLERTGLERYVEPVFAKRSYTWELMRLLEEQARFDFAFIDGAHTWDADGFAFFLIDRMLDMGGWVCFDDLHWSYEESPALKENPQVQAMPAEERRTAQIGKVFDLLVAPHPHYAAHRDGNWGWAQKTTALASRPGWPVRSRWNHRLARWLRTNVGGALSRLRRGEAGSSG